MSSGLVGSARYLCGPLERILEASHCNITLIPMLRQGLGRIMGNGGHIFLACPKNNSMATTMGSRY
eukprot:scaffold161729_cov60-Attheya_sp.AAC.4